MDLTPEQLEAIAKAGFACAIKYDDNLLDPWEDDDQEDEREAWRQVVLAILSAYEAARPGGWQPMETAPKDGTEVLLLVEVGYKKKLGRQTVYRKGKFHCNHWYLDGWRASNDPLNPETPTHWQHLPSPPDSPDAKGTTCKGCGKPLLPGNAWMTDGCPCNSPLGCNDELAIRSLLAEIVNDASPSTTGCNMLVSESLIERAKELCS